VERSEKESPAKKETGVKSREESLRSIINHVFAEVKK